MDAPFVRDEGRDGATRGVADRVAAATDRTHAITRPVVSTGGRGQTP